MRVAFITQWWHANQEGISPGIVDSLQAQGATVSILAGRGGLNGQTFGPRWRLRDRRAWQGAPLTTYPYFQSHDSSTVRRLLTYSTFSASSSLASSDLRDYDVALVYGSPATAAAPALVANRRFGTPYVFHAQDIWPDSIFATGFLTEGPARSLAEATVGRFVASTYRHAAGVVGISPGARQLLVSRGVPAAKAHHVYNWIADDAHIEPLPIPERRPDQPLHLMYAGSVGLAQNLDNVLDALALLPAGTARLTLLGDGPAVSSLRRRAQELNLDNVTFAGRVARADVPALQATAHFHLISLADQELFRITIPSKLQALAAHGAPILCTAPGEVADIVASNRMGLTAAPGDAAALAQVIVEAARLRDDDLRDMGAHGRELYFREMSRDIGAKKLFDILMAASQSR